LKHGTLHFLKRWPQQEQEEEEEEKDGQWYEISSWSKKLCTLLQ